ncbi:nucleotide exchange factor GrpE [Arthrobacter sp. CAU 1506]|uniref:nucleotide exchange factor GrpE n=1 Tax=Arthrobacter sp. CAU 1506 TaxID=2560052 RepID=UPI0010ACB4EA|nr:nucleotide exchange factor GrpE [Arthrobacter sp. CAU 1506]TJY69808.1 nucleotide exchange factor GrpE [Arthrobacter sp. CAU 1506]
MANGNEEEHQSEPVNFRDNRKIDPETGKVRGAAAGSGDGTADQAAGTAPAAGADADALAQAEEILNGAEVPAGESVAQGTTSQEAEELRNDLLRLQAEYVNYRKRVERDRAVAGEMAVIGVMNSLLPVLDDIDAARQHGDLADGPFAAIATKLDGVLKTYGLTRIEETGVEFDPNIHEALMQQPDANVEVDSVSQILRLGYKSGDRVLRAAQVVVAVPAE